MIKFKKFLAATMTTAMIFGTVAMAVPATSVYAATPTIDKVDYENFTIDVTPSDGVVFLEVLKTNDEDSKVSATYCFVGTAKTTIDLSFLKATKEQYIRFYGVSGERSDIITIAAQPQKFTAKFSLKDTVANSFAGKGFDATKIGTDYQYKGLYASVWKDMGDLTVAMLQNLSVTGTTLVLRTKAVKASSLASAEVKVKISAAAKAPKVKIDYAKGEVSTGKGVEYTKDLSGTWTDVSATKLSVEDFLSGASVSDNATKDSVIYVRTKATDKKAASNIALVTIPKATKFADGTPTETSTAYSGSIAMGDEASNKITFKTVVNKDDDSKATLEIKAEGASFDFSTDGGKTWKTVKAGKTFSVEQTGQTITVRRSGDKAKELLPSTSKDFIIKAYTKSNS